jgi:hypothetical protein
MVHFDLLFPNSYNEENHQSMVKIVCLSTNGVNICATPLGTFIWTQLYCPNLTPIHSKDDYIKMDLSLTHIDTTYM